MTELRLHTLSLGAFWPQSFSAGSTRLVTWLILSLVLCLMSPSVAEAGASPSPVTGSNNVIWFETPVAEITVGYDSARKESRQRSFYLSYAGPKNAVPGLKPDGVAMTRARACAESTVHPIRTQLQNALARANNLNARLPPSERTARSISATNAGLLTAASTKMGDFFACLTGKKDSGVNETDFSLVLVQRNCTTSACPISKSHTRLSDDPEALYFANLYEWMASKVAVEQRSTTGLLMRLETLTQPDSSAMLQASIFTADETNVWLPDVDVSTMSLQFAEMVAHVRDSRRANVEAPRLSPYAAVVSGLSRPDLLKVADAITAPIAAYALTPEGLVNRMSSVSNEMARAQVFNCRSFQGQSSLEQIKTCSGYTLDDQQLNSCLAGGTCQAVLNSQTSLANVLQNAPLSLDQIAAANPYARDKVADVAALKARYDACHTTAMSEPGANSCFMVETFGKDPTLKKAQSCLQMGDRTAQTRCALNTISPGAEMALNCVQGASAGSAARCLITSNLPPQEQKLYECMAAINARSSVAACGSLAGGSVGKLATCAQSQRESLAVLACFAGDKLSTPQREALQCIATNTSSFASAAACVATTQMPPAVAKQIGCVMESQGSPMAAGVCIATSSLNLTPEQQLALQCLASSGGQPYAFAVCFGGQLTMREMVKCKGKMFGEEPCFGHNNEFQKLAHALTGNDIGPNTVVGQVLTVEIAPATYIVGMAQPIIQVGMNSVSESIENAKRSFQDLAKGDFGGLARDAVDAATNPLRAAQDLWHTAFG